MVIFHSYVKLPVGNPFGYLDIWISHVFCSRPLLHLSCDPALLAPFPKATPCFVGVVKMGFSCRFSLLPSSSIYTTWNNPHGHFHRGNMGRWWTTMKPPNLGGFPTRQVKNSRVLSPVPRHSEKADPTTTYPNPKGDFASQIRGI